MKLEFNSIEEVKDFMQQLGQSPVPYPVPSFNWSEIAEDFARIGRGQKLYAIKLFRQVTGCTLLQAKTHIESCWK